MLIQFILISPFLVAGAAAFFLKSKPYFWSSILLSLSLSSWAVIFYFIRIYGPQYGGVDFGFAFIVIQSWYVTIPLVFIGLFIGTRLALKKSVILSVLFLSIWVGLSLWNNLSIELKAKKAKQQATINCETMPYHCAINENRISDLSLLKSQNYDIESKDGKGYTALNRYLYNVEAVNALLKLGANPNSRGGRANRQALTLALVGQKPQIETAKLLIKYGADVNKGYLEADTDKHMTLLGYAISHKYTNLIIFLIKHGSDTRKKDGYGYDACERARLYQLNEIEELNILCQN